MKNRLIYLRVLYMFFPLLCVACSFSAGCSAPPQPGPPIVTNEEVEQIKVGMTLEDAQKIIGDPGQPTGPGGDSPLTAHIWTNEDGSLLTVTFMNGKVQQISPANFK